MILGALFYCRENSMNRVFVSLIVLFIGLGAILIVQAMQTSTSRVFTPSELAHREEPVKRIRVVGKVAPQELEYQTEPQIRLSFHIQDPEGEQKETVRVEYDKLMPDMFAPGRSVIIDGEYTGSVVKAESLMTQCPSKYEPPTPTSSGGKGMATDFKAKAVLAAGQRESIEDEALVEGVSQGGI